MPHHAHAGGGGRLVGQPDFFPLAVRAAPPGADLPGILARTVGNQAKTVD